MRSPELYLDENGIQFGHLQTCNCCPYGYHIDLDFIRYIESLENGSPSDGELLRRDKRRSRLSKEFMLGLESMYTWEPPYNVQPVPEAQFESELESPRFASTKSIYDEISWFNGSESSNHSITSSIMTSSPPETSAFLHDALDEVVSDFERTLERTKNKDKRNGFHSLEQYADALDSCVSRSKTKSQKNGIGPSTQHFVEVRQQKKLEDIEEADFENNNLINEKRDHFKDYLIRIQELEEQLKCIPALQKQLGVLQVEKQQLQLQLHQEEEEKVKLKKQLQHFPPAPPIRTTSTNITNTINNKGAFTPQRISPVLLESLGSRIRSNSHSSADSQLLSQPPPLSSRKVITRDVAIMCQQLKTQTRDVGTLVAKPTNRSIGINPANTINIKDDLYTKHDFDKIISQALKDQEENNRKIRLRNLISVGTQMVPLTKVQLKNAQIQTSPEKKILMLSQSVMVKPNQKDQMISCKTETKTIGSSEHKITDILCEKCSINKRTVSCGPDEKETKAYLAMKQAELLGSRSLSFSLGQNEKLNIKRKTIATQYESKLNHIGTQISIQSMTLGTQFSPISETKSLQCNIASNNAAKETDTKDLIKLISSFTNTESYQDKNLPITSNSSSNTDVLKTRESGTNTEILKTRENGINTNILRTREHGINTEKFKTRDSETNTLADVSSLTLTRHSASNTEQVHKKDIGCGEVIKPHIHIACADNYCDSCKDAIKNLAKEFSKVLASPILGSSPDQSKIPRPTTLPSPKSVRRKFVRQNTYTVSSTEPSPVSEKENIESAIKTEQISTSLDSVINPTKSPTGKRKNDNESNNLSKSLHEEKVVEDKQSQLTVAASAAESVSLQQESKEKSIKKLSLEKLWSKDSKPSSSNVQLPEVRTKDIDEREAPKVESKIYPETSRQATSRAIQNMILNQIATATSEPREKVTPSKEMKAALKVINDSIQKSTLKSNHLKNANAIVQKEWFTISSTDKANPLNVEDYLDCFEEFSIPLLKYMVNMSDANGNTAMHYAVSHGNFDVVSILLDSKVCNVNQMNNAGYTCVMLVSLAKLKNSAHRTVVQRLFQMADVNIRAKKHCQTALMLAVSHGNLDMVEMLLAAGADINIQDEDGSTSLMCAAEHGRIDIVKHLLSQSDCDSLIQDVDSSTAFKIAWQAGHRDIGLLLYVHEQMLRSKMPNQKSPITPRHSKHQQSQPPQPPPSPSAK